MRVLTGGATGRSRVAIACLAAGASLLGLAAAWWLVDALVGGGAATALAASPDPTLRPGTDTRTSGGGPGFVGEPLLAVLGVLGVGVAEPRRDRGLGPPDRRPRTPDASRSGRAAPRERRRVARSGRWYFRPIGKKCGVR